MNKGCLGWIPQKSHAAIVSLPSEDSGCDAGRLIGTPEFHSATRAGASPCPSRRRSLAHAACVRSLVSGHRPRHTAPRHTRIASAGSSGQEIPGPFSRR
jgi:hypothetical protein